MAEAVPEVTVVDWLVIGAGISGLGFANWWREHDPNAKILVCEAEAEPGGYCKTITRDGFVWDYSGHFFHFKDPTIEAWLRENPASVTNGIACTSIADIAAWFSPKATTRPRPHRTSLKSRTPPSPSRSKRCSPLGCSRVTGRAHGDPAIRVRARPYHRI